MRIRKRSWKHWGLLTAILAIPAMALSQAGDAGGVLVVAGGDGQATLVRLRGKSYVELEDLARLTRGSLSFNGKQTTLTLPGTTGTVVEKSPANPEFSKDFLRSGIEEMTVIREWRIALTNAIQRGIPVTGDWMGLYQGQAQKDLRLASVAAGTDSDRNAYQLLSNEYDKMKKLSDRFVAEHASQTYTSPDSLESDPLNQQVLTCARALAAMAATGQYVDDGSCH
jgi:hypothetical protein